MAGSGNIILALAPVAQLDRVSDYESEGRGFESLPAHQGFPEMGNLFLLPFTGRFGPSPEGTRTARPAVRRPGRAPQSCGLWGRARAEGPLPAHKGFPEMGNLFLLPFTGRLGPSPEGTRTARPAVRCPGRAPQSCGLWGRARAEGPLPAHQGFPEMGNLFLLPFTGRLGPAFFICGGAASVVH